jgi:hypothetical protein
VSAAGERFFNSRFGVKDCAWMLVFRRVVGRRSEELTARPRINEKTRARMKEG